MIELGRGMIFPDRYLREQPDGPDPCEWCEGIGEVDCETCGGFGCVDCQRSGTEPCAECNGSGCQ